MKTKYRVYVISEIPPDLKDRIAAIHASGILKSRGEEGSIQGAENKQNRLVPVLSKRVR